MLSFLEMLRFADRFGLKLASARRKKKSRRDFWAEAHQIYVNGNGTTAGDNGLVGILQRFVADDLLYHIFISPTVAIDNTLTLAGVTELAVVGYAAQTVAAADFSLGSVTANNGSLLAAPIAFGTNGTGGNISVYGYYATDVGSTVLFFAANFDSFPIVVPSGGALPMVVPVVGDFSQFLS